MSGTIAQLYVELHGLDRAARDNVEEACRWWCDNERLHSGEMFAKLQTSWLHIGEDLESVSVPNTSLNAAAAAVGDDDSGDSGDTLRRFHHATNVLAASLTAMSDIIADADAAYVANINLAGGDASKPKHQQQQVHQPQQQPSTISAQAFFTLPSSASFSPSAQEPLRASTQGPSVASSSSLVAAVDEKAKRAASSLIKYLIDVELPEVMSTCDQKLYSVRDALDNERNQAVLVEVSQRGASRQRLQRLAKLEAERRLLERELSAAKAECAAIQKRVEVALSKSQSNRNQVFSRFTAWDLHRRTLSHVLHHQSLLAKNVERLGEEITLGMVALPAPSLPSQSAMVEGESNASVVDEGDHYYRSHQATPTGSARRKDAIVVGSVELLERLQDRWEVLQSSVPSYEVRDAPAEANASQHPTEQLQLHQEPQHGGSNSMIGDTTLAPPQSGRPIAHRSIRTPRHQQPHTSAANGGVAQQRDRLPFTSQPPPSPHRRAPPTTPLPPAYSTPLSVPGMYDDDLIHARHDPSVCDNLSQPRLTAPTQLPLHQREQSLTQHSQRPRMHDFLPSTAYANSDALKQLASRRADVHSRLFPGASR